MEIQNQAVLQFVFSYSIDTDQQSPFKDMIVLPDSQLALIFQKSFIIYNLSLRKKISSTPLKYPLESPQIFGHNIVALSLDHKNIVLLSGSTGEFIFQNQIKIDDKFLMEDVEMFVFNRSNMIAVVFREQFMLEKKMFVYSKNLEPIKIHSFKLSFFQKFDNMNCLVSFNQITHNDMVISIFNIETSTLQKIQIKQGIPNLSKQTLIVVKRMSQNEMILGFNLMNKSQWYIFDLENKHFKLLCEANNLGKFLKLQNDNQITYFGYQLLGDKREGFLVKIHHNGRIQRERMNYPTNSYIDYEEQKSILIYNSQIKRISPINFQLIRSIRKRALMANMIKNSRISEFGNGVFRAIFKVVDLKNKQESRQQSPQIKVQFVSLKETVEQIVEKTVQLVAEE